MAWDWLKQPVTETEPCGPDLEKSDDPDFLDYYFEAESRLPERYFTPGVPNLLGGSEDQLFDPRTVLLRGETEAITGLLQRSRDLRLLSLLARFQILAARPADFADTLEAAADLLEAQGDLVHPQVLVSASERRGALDALAEQTTVVMPLIHLPFLSNADISYRSFLVADGATEPRASEAESTATTGDIVSTLKNAANVAPLTALHAALSRAAQAYSRIVTLSRKQSSHPFTPDFSAVLATIADLQGLIAEALPTLAPWTNSASPEQELPEAELEPAATLDTPAPQPAHLPQAGAVHIASHGQARAVISAAETYLAQNEPSSLSLLLVTQARLLVGKSLVEAIELLRPHEAERAALNLGRGLGFSLDMSRLRLLAQSSPQLRTEGGDDGDSHSPRETKSVVISDRGQLASNLRGVEEFYMRNEPASPVPVLLGSARTMLTKTFDAILSELLPQTPEQV